MRDVAAGGGGHHRPSSDQQKGLQQLPLSDSPHMQSSLKPTWAQSGEAWPGQHSTSGPSRAAFRSG